MADPIELKGLPSSFVVGTSPEAAQGESTSGGESTAGSEPAVKTDTYRFPTLAITIPNKLVPPDDMLKRGRGVVFPTIDPGSPGRIRVKYLNEWQNIEKRGGHRSSAKNKGYVGYRGREVSFTAILDDADVRTVALGATNDVVDLLRAWSTMSTTEAMLEQPMKRAILKFKKQVDPERMRQLAGEAWEALQGKTPDAFGQEHGDVLEVKLDNAGYSTPPTLQGLDKPKPPLPLIFRFGTIVISPCVIKKLVITATRYVEWRITAASVNIVLQEVELASLWALSDTTPNNFIEDVSTELPTPKPKEEQPEPDLAELDPLYGVGG
jgi:hypothetical protein